MLNARSIAAAALAAAMVTSPAPSAAADAPAAAPPAAAAAAAPAAAAPAKAEDAGPVARVNGVPIARADYERHWRYFLQRSGIPLNHQDKEDDSGKVDEFRTKVLERLIDEELLYQAAKSEKLLAGEEAVQAELANAREQFPSPEAFAEALEKNGLTEDGLRALFARNLTIKGYVEGHLSKGAAVSDAEVHEFYTANAATFASPEAVRARHILVAAAEGDDAAARAEKRKKAEALLARLKAGEDFEKLAKENSECPSAPEGGDLGFFERGQMAGPFEEAAFALKPGELSGVVETEFGFHLIRLEERREAGTIPEADVAPNIREFLTAQKTEAAVEERLKRLRGEAKIETLL